MIWSLTEWAFVSKVKLDGHPDFLTTQDSKAAKSNADILVEMTKIAQTIQDGAMSFLTAEYTYMSEYTCMVAYLIVFSFIFA